MNVLVRDMDLALPNAHEARRLEILVDGLPLFGSAELAVDTTPVSPIRGNGSARPGAAGTDGFPLAQADARRNALSGAGRSQISWKRPILANPVLVILIWSILANPIGQSIFGSGVCHGGAQKGGARKGGGAQNFALFFPLPLFRSFLCLSGCLV